MNTMNTTRARPEARGERVDTGADPRLEDALRYAVAIGAVLVLLLPAARGSHAAIGWLPMWLLAMPLAAWWALHGFGGPVARMAGAVTRLPVQRPRRPGPQARRRVRLAKRLVLPHAA